MKKNLFFILMSVICLNGLSANATSLTLNVLPGHLKEQLLDNSSEPDELILTGTLNSEDLNYINTGTGKISMVSVLDISRISLDYDEGSYASGQDRWTNDIGEILLNRTFLLSDNPRTESKSNTDALGWTHVYYYHYTNDLSGLFINNKTLKKVILPSSISEFGNYICAASSIEDVVFPSSTNKIPDYAFTKSEIKRINLENIVSIGAGAFKESAIETFNFSKIRSLGDRSFYRAKQLTGKIELSELGEIPYNCFNQTALNEVTIGKGISRICAGAFYGIDKLTSVYISEGVEYLERLAFSSKYITTFNVPSTIIDIEDSALPSDWAEKQPAEDNVIYFGDIAYQYINNNSNLTDVIFKEGTRIISSGFATQIAVAYRRFTSVYIPASVTRIDNKAFSECESLEKITFAENSKLEYLGDECFYYCSALCDIEIPQSVIIIGDKCFSGCDALTEITLPSNLRYIGDKAFNARWIKNLPATLEYIGYQAFYGATLPGSITLGKDLRYIGDNAFANCLGLYNVTVECNSLENENVYGAFSGIEKVNIKNNVTRLPSGMFADLSTLSKLDFEDSDATEPPLIIGSNCFRNCSSMLLDRIPSRLIEIGEYSFEKCKLPNDLSTENLTKIGEHAFSECTGLVNLEIKNSLTSLGGYAFERINSLKCVYYNAVNLDAGQSIFYGYPDYAPIKSVVIGKNVEVIPAELFKKLRSLTSITFEPREVNTILKIGSSAFNGSWGYEELWLPDGVSEIGDRAFYDSYLAYLHLGKGLKSIGNYAFDRTHLGVMAGGIDLPETVEYIGNQAIPTNVHKLYCHSENPPVFGGTVAPNIRFYAPQQYLEKYKTAFPDNSVESYYDSDFILTGGEVEVGKTYSIFPNFTREEFSDLNLTWESSNPEVFKIYDSYGFGILEVVDEGSATITARFVHHDGAPQTCKVYTSGFDSVDNIIKADNETVRIKVNPEESSICGLSPGSNVGIYNIYGVELFAGQADTTGKISIPNLDRGIYILKTESEIIKIRI